jgi:hypothetical protein
MAVLHLRMKIHIPKISMNGLVKKVAFILIVGVLLLGGMAAESNAQCAMCRVTVENNVSNGDSSVASGLNKGILMLLATPYAAFAIITFFWYRNSRRGYDKRFKVSGYPRS